MASENYAQNLKKFWPIAESTYLNVEMDFLHAHPEVVGQDLFFKPFEEFFKHGPKNVDWVKTEAKMRAILKSIFMSDYSALSKEIKLGEEEKKAFFETNVIFVMAKDKITKKLLGFISFMITPKFAKNEVKCTMFAVKTEEQNRGIGKMLMNSIFKIMPETERIFLCTRITNEKAQNAYYNWGFVKDPNPDNLENGYTFNLDHWIFLEYNSNRSNILQNSIHHHSR